MTLTNPAAPADQLRTILNGSTFGDVGVLLQLARDVLGELDALAPAAVRLAEENQRLRESLTEILGKFARAGLTAEGFVFTLPMPVVNRWRATLAELASAPGATAAPTIAAGADYPAAADVDGPACALCGCTEERACPGGCAWLPNALGVDVCTACADTLAADLAALDIDEVWLLDDDEHDDPGIWPGEAEAKARGEKDGLADWQIRRPGVPVTFTWEPFGDVDDPGYMLIAHTPGLAAGDALTGITVRHLNVNTATIDPADIWRGSRTAWGTGHRDARGKVTFTSPPMSAYEARRRLAQLRAFFPETAEQYQLLRWRIGPALVVRDDQDATAADQEKDEAASGFATDNEAIADTNQPADEAQK